MHFRASVCIHRHNHAATAKLERLASIFEREHYFHHAHISGMIAAGLLSPVILYVEPSAGAFRAVKTV